MHCTGVCSLEYNSSSRKRERENISYTFYDMCHDTEFRSSPVLLLLSNMFIVLKAVNDRCRTQAADYTLKGVMNLFLNEILCLLLLPYRLVGC